MKKLNSPSINQMFGFFEDPAISKAYLVLENAGQKTLRDFIDQEGISQQEGTMLREEKVRDIMDQLLRATNYLHSNNVVHRDLKPDNIMVSTETRPFENN